MQYNHTSFFSIILPTYNRGGIISETISSVLQQTYTNWELLIIDDGSTDNTKTIVEAFSDDRIKYFYKCNEERSIARNYGIDKAKSNYICFLDSDDLYLENHLEVLYQEILKTDQSNAVYYTGVVQTGDKVIKKTPFYSRDNYGHPFYYIWKEKLLINSVCVPKSMLQRDRFPPRFNIWEDTHLWLRLALKYPLYQIREYTTQRKIHDESTVALMFDKSQFRDIKTYMECMSDFYDSNKEKVNKFITLAQFNDVKRSVILRVLSNLTFYRTPMRYVKFYLLGLKHCDFKKFHRDLIQNKH